MKKTINYFTVICAGALAIAGCQKPEMESNAAVSGDRTIITATLSEDGADSKTQMLPGSDADSYKVVWQAGDAIKTNGITSTEINISSANASSATFTFDGGVFDAPYYAVYPTAVASGFENNKYTLTLPEEQAYAGSDKFAPESALMLGYSATSGNVAFKHAMAYIRLTLTSGENPIKSVKLESNNQEALSGSFTAVCTDGIWTMSEGSTASVTLNCGAEGAAIGEKMLIAIPADTYEGGLTVTVTDTKNHYMARKATNSFTAEMGGIYDMAFEFVAQGTVVEGNIDINTVDDWTAFAKAVTGGDTYEGKTITLQSNLTVDTYFEYANGTFEGTFDGNGKTMTANGNKYPLFCIIGKTGIVKNLTTDGKYTEFISYGEAGNATISKINLGLIENCTNNADTEITKYTKSIVFGSIVGQNGGILKGCKNYGNIKVTVAMNENATDAGFYGGGLAAIGHTITGSASNGILNTDANCSPGSFIDCENHGNIEAYTAKDGSEETFAPIKSGFGGICGIVYLDGVTFTGCHNYGNINRKDNGAKTSSYFSSVGGILGRSAATNVPNKTYGAIDANAAENGYKTIFTNCTNSGTLRNYCRHSDSVKPTDSGARKDATGGIVGAICGKSEAAQVINCTNTGTIYTGWAAVSSGVSGGIAGTANNTKFLDCTSTGTVGTESSSNPLGATGGIVGMAIKDVVFDGCKATNNVTMYYASGKTLYWGLCCGIIITSASITKTNKVCSFGGSASVNGTAQNISAENYKTLLTAAAGKVLTYDDANVSYSAN